MITFLLWTYDDIYWNKRIKRAHWIELKMRRVRIDLIIQNFAELNDLSKSIFKKIKFFCSFCRTSLLITVEKKLKTRQFLKLLLQLIRQFFSAVIKRKKTFHYQRIFEEVETNQMLCCCSGFDMVKTGQITR